MCCGSSHICRNFVTWDNDSFCHSQAIPKRNGKKSPKHMLMGIKAQKNPIHFLSFPFGCSVFLCAHDISLLHYPKARDRDAFRSNFFSLSECFWTKFGLVTCCHSFWDVNLLEGTSVVDNAYGVEGSQRSTFLVYTFILIKRSGSLAAFPVGNIPIF